MHYQSYITWKFKRYCLHCEIDFAWQSKKVYIRTFEASACKWPIRAQSNSLAMMRGFLTPVPIDSSTRINRVVAAVVQLDWVLLHKHIGKLQINRVSVSATSCSAWSDDGCTLIWYLALKSSSCWFEMLVLRFSNSGLSMEVENIGTEVATKLYDGSSLPPGSWLGAGEQILTSDDFWPFERPQITDRRGNDAA